MIGGESNLHSIYPTGSRIKFSNQEALSLVGIMIRITRKSSSEINRLKAITSHFKGNKNKEVQMQNEINQEVQKWSEKVIRLGAIPLSLWKVKILSRDDGNHFIWEFPAGSLQFIRNPL